MAGHGRLATTGSQQWRSRVDRPLTGELASSSATCLGSPVQQELRMVDTSEQRANEPAAASPMDAMPSLTRSRDGPPRSQEELPDMPSRRFMVTPRASQEHALWRRVHQIIVPTQGTDTLFQPHHRQHDRVETTSNGKPHIGWRARVGIRDGSCGERHRVTRPAIGAGVPLRQGRHQGRSSVTGLIPAFLTFATTSNSRTAVVND
jgi:hypothetical protein